MEDTHIIHFHSLLLNLLVNSFISRSLFWHLIQRIFQLVMDHILFNQRTNLKWEQFRLVLSIPAKLMSHGENTLLILHSNRKKYKNTVLSGEIYARRQEQELFIYRDSAFVFGGLKAFNFFAFFCFVALEPDWNAFQLSTLDCRDSSKFFCHSRSNAACASADSSSSRFLLRCSASRVANSLLCEEANEVI